jgi:hypothetical protein
MKIFYGLSKIISGKISETFLKKISGSHTPSLRKITFISIPGQKSTRAALRGYQYIHLRLKEISS